MKIPSMTSAERRGILGVALAALICTGAGVALRQCHSSRIEALPPAPSPRVITAATDSAATDTGAAGEKRVTSRRKRARSSARKETPALSPRDPLGDTVPVRR
ncbi:MAG: hypothetical protein K2O24_04025 [Muribaculaceae bacterium]|nr:hypothetical protein [Muribaculaceae bacterium]